MEAYMNIDQAIERLQRLRVFLECSNTKEGDTDGEAISVVLGQLCAARQGAPKQEVGAQVDSGMKVESQDALQYALHCVSVGIASNAQATDLANALVTAQAECKRLTQELDFSGRTQANLALEIQRLRSQVAQLKAARAAAEQWGVWCLQDRAWCEGSVGTRTHAETELARWVSGERTDATPGRFTYEARPLYTAPYAPGASSIGKV